MASAHSEAPVSKSPSVEALDAILDTIDSQVDDDGGATITELSEAAGIGRTTMRQRVAAAVEDGRLLAGRARREDSQGYMRWAKVYRNP